MENIRRREGSNEANEYEIMKRLLQLRWLIVDEISMVSAKLLADMDMKLRSTCRFIDKHALNADGSIKPFGGLHVLCS